MTKKRVQPAAVADTVTPKLAPKIILLFPVHLFELDTLPIPNKAGKSVEIILWEHPVYYGIHAKQAHLHMKYNKLKLAYVRATCLSYMDYLKSHGFLAEFVPVDAAKTQLAKLTKRLRASAESVAYFDPVDNIVQSELDTIFGKAVSMAGRIVTPGFLLSDNDLEEYWKQSSHTRFYHSSFYAWVRKRLDILPGSKTYDTENRSKLPPSVKVPELVTDSHHSRHNSQAAKHWKMARDFVCAKWSGNPGRDGDMWSTVFPLTHDESVEWLDRFVDERFNNFGKYQDSIAVSADGQPRNYLFHACISPMLNIGLLTPKQVIDVINKAKDKVPMAAYEGFIRQIIGWREYQRYIYKYAGDKMRTSNHFGNNRRLTAAWYNGTTGLKPVDDTIKMAFKDGYLHHILRLMVMGNIMNLVGIHPDDVYKWFMEFSLDSYDWVMIGNVYSMALWADGGMSMRKPYISSSGYILSMSNYSKNKPDNWSDTWDAVNHHFIDRNSSALLKTYYAGVVRAWNKKPASDRKQELDIANKFIKQVSNSG